MRGGGEVEEYEKGRDIVVGRSLVGLDSLHGWLGCRFRRVGRSWDDRWTSRAMICKIQDLRGRLVGEKEAIGRGKTNRNWIVKKFGRGKKLRGCGKYNREGG